MNISCLYCAEQSIIRRVKSYEDPAFISESPSENIYYICPACGLYISNRDILETNKSGQPSNRSHPGDYPDELRTLDSAWQLMQKSKWNQALTELHRCRRPFEHPLEFMFYRNICQAAPLLSGEKTDQGKLRLLLDIMLNNIKRLDYYLHEEDRDITFAVYKRLFDAFILFGDLPVKRHKDYCWSSRTLKCSQANYRRAVLLSSFADVLEMETISNRRYCADYLKMSVQLLQQSLYTSQEKIYKFIIYFYFCPQMLQIPQGIRWTINDRITQLYTEIKMLDSQFSLTLPPQPPKIFYLKISYYIGICIYLSIIFALLFIAMFSFYLAENVDTYNLWYNFFFFANSTILVWLFGCIVRTVINSIKEYSEEFLTISSLPKDN